MVNTVGDTIAAAGIDITRVDDGTDILVYKGNDLFKALENQHQGFVFLRLVNKGLITLHRIDNFKH